MDIETFDFGSRIGPDVQAVLANRYTASNYSHEDLWRLIQVWYANAEHWDNKTLGQCAYELSALIGPLALANPTDRVIGKEQTVTHHAFDFHPEDFDGTERDDGCGGSGSCAIGIADLNCANCELQLRLDATAAHARGDFEKERQRLDTLALIERRAT